MYQSVLNDQCVDKNGNVVSQTEWTKKHTPGFELVALLGALAVVLIILRRKL